MNMITIICVIKAMPSEEHNNEHIDLLDLPPGTLATCQNVTFIKRVYSFHHPLVGVGICDAPKLRTPNITRQL